MCRKRQKPKYKNIYGRLSVYKFYGAYNAGKEEGSSTFKCIDLIRPPPRR